MSLTSPTLPCGKLLGPSLELASQGFSTLTGEAQMRGYNERAYRLGHKAFEADPEKFKNLLTISVEGHGLSPKAGVREVKSFQAGFTDAKKGRHAFVIGGA